MCGKMDLGCYIKDGFQSVATSAMDQLREQVSKSALSTLDSMTFWLQPKTPALANEHTWASSGTVEFLHSSLLGVTGAVFAIAIVIAGMRMAWEQRAKPLQDLLKAMLTFVVVAGMGTATLQLLISWSDSFSVAIIDKVAHDMSLAASFGGPVDGDGKVRSIVADTMPAVLAIVSSLAVIVASLIQMVLMLVRSALLVLLAGAFPLAAAATNTEIGRNWFRKFCGWSLAFIAYKPAAALVYAAAMKLAHDHAVGSGDAGGNGLVPAMTGMMMLLLAIAALPALLRFMVPVTAAVAGGGSAMGSSVADPGGMATGAVSVGSSASGSARGAAGATGSSAGGGGGATGAALAGGKAAGAAASSAGVGLAAARKAAGGVSGAASHSAGESGGGAVTPSSASGPMAGRSAHRASRPSRSHTSSPTAHEATPEPVGPTGA
ncbi:hypothetical protein ACXJJ3_21670 [Kribbella sp. WER1]